VVLLVVVEERLRAIRSEVRREHRGTLPPLGAAGLTATVFDVERPGLLTGALAFPGDRGVQPDPRSKGTVVTGQLILFVQHRDESRLAGRTGVLKRSHHPVAHLPVQRAVGKVLPAKFPVLWLMVHARDYRKPVLKHQLVVGGLHAALVTGLPVVECPVLRQRFAGDIVVVDHDDVIVCLPAAAVDVRNDEDVRVRMHLLRK
jgi:hypothetical protein